VPVQQSRAIVAPKGTPKEVVDRLRAAFGKAFESQAYKDFNTGKLLTPHQISGEEVKTEWTAAATSYKELTTKYGINLGGDK